MKLPALIVAAIIACLLGTVSALAADRGNGYTVPTYAALTNTLLRFKSIDLSKNETVDEYAIITQCDLYKEFFADDFKWQRIRKAIRESVKQNMPTFPIKYSAVGSRSLGRYNFEGHVFLFQEPIKNVGIFSLYSATADDMTCQRPNVLNRRLTDDTVQFLPHDFKATLDYPVTIPGIPMPENEAQALLDRMQKFNNPTRQVYVRFNLQITFIEKLNTTFFGAISMDARLDSADFFEDKEMKKLLWTYTP